LIRGSSCAIFLGLVLLAFRALATSPLSPALGSDMPGATCSTPSYREFDFWLGDWDVFEIDGTAPVAHVRVERTLDGCALRETYESTDGMRGESLSAYDASRQLWQQSWFTNRGQLLVIEGHRNAAAMVLQGTRKSAEGVEIVRGTWKPESAGVRETAVTSTDGGKTWKPWFDLMFRKYSK